MSADDERYEPQPDVRQPQSAVFLRPIGSSIPLGFLGLAVATLSLAGVELGWVRTAESHQVGWILIAFAFPVQFVAAVLAFLARDPVVGAGLGVQSGVWVTIGVLTVQSPSGSRSDALSLFLLVAAAALIPSIISASLSKGVVGLVLGLTAARWVITGVFERVGGAPWKVAAGWLGLALCVTALYAAAALELEDQRGHTVLPTLRHGAGRRALADGLRAADNRLDREAGVRNQL